MPSLSLGGVGRGGPTSLKDIYPGFPECSPADHVPGPASPPKRVSAHLPLDGVRLGEGSPCLTDRLGPVRKGELDQST